MVTFPRHSLCQNCEVVVSPIFTPRTQWSFWGRDEGPVSRSHHLPPSWLELQLQLQPPRGSSQKQLLLHRSRSPPDRPVSFGVLGCAVICDLRSPRDLREVVAFPLVQLCLFFRDRSQHFPQRHVLDQEPEVPVALGITNTLPPSVVRMTHSCLSLNRNSNVVRQNLPLGSSFHIFVQEAFLCS